MVFVHGSASECCWFSVQLSELQESKSVEHRVFETEEITRLQEELKECQLSLQEKLKVKRSKEERAPDALSLALI